LSPLMMRGACTTAAACGARVWDEFSPNQPFMLVKKQFSRFGHRERCVPANFAFFAYDFQLDSFQKCQPCSQPVRNIRSSPTRITSLGGLLDPPVLVSAVGAARVSHIRRRLSAEKFVDCHPAASTRAGPQSSRQRYPPQPPLSAPSPSTIAAKPREARILVADSTPNLDAPTFAPLSARWTP